MYIFMKLAEGHAHGEIPGHKAFSDSRGNDFPPGQAHL